MRSYLVFFALLMGMAAGCEHGVTIKGNVTVPLEVQRLFSAEQPGSVEVWGTIVGGSAGPLVYLCAPSEEALVLPYTIDKFGCAEEQLIEARAFRLRPDPLGRVRCGEADPASSGGLLADELAYGAATIFQGRGSPPCSSGSASADVTLAPKE